MLRPSGVVLRPRLRLFSFSHARTSNLASSQVWIRPHYRTIHDYIRGSTEVGTYKVPLSSPKVVGIATSRGYRPYQEDASAVSALQISPIELSDSLAKLKLKEKEKVEWDHTLAGGEFLAGQVAFFGIYDGHGGKEVSTYLKDNLHKLIESGKTEDVQKVVDWTKDRHAGYYKRWRGGDLRRWTSFAQNGTKPQEGEGLTIEERVALAFLKADQEILESIEKAQRCGSTASVAMIHSLDQPAQPYWAAKKLSLTIGHCGDTRVLLCHRPTGNVIALTEKHHVEARVEAARLRRMGASLAVADSFGESRFMGVVENTRGLGDGEWKPSGVTAEPEVSTRILDGEEYSYMILVTDGLTSTMSNQEISDLARRSIDPTRAAKTIVHFAEDLGAQDNCTALVVPLAGWGKVGGEDMTEERREYRKKQMGNLSTRMQRM